MIGVSLAVRGVVLLAGAVLVLLPPPHSYVLTSATMLGVVVAAAAPNRVGSALASAAFLIDWLTASGWHHEPALARTVVAAAALYVLHVSTSMAACLPAGARAGKSVVLGWVRRCALPVAATVVIGAVDAVLPKRSGTALAELAGLLGVVAVALALTYALRRGDPALDKMAGRAGTSAQDGSTT